MIYVPNNFKKEDFFPPDFLQLFNGRCWEWMNPMLLHFLDSIDTKTYGRFFINNYNKGGQLKNCGFRMFDCVDGAKYSKHKYGVACDLHFVDVPKEKFYSDCVMRKPEFDVITQMENIEDTPSWVHIAVVNCDFIIVRGK
jgi:hypothetical protein